MVRPALPNHQDNARVSLAVLVCMCVCGGYGACVHVHVCICAHVWRGAWLRHT